MRDITERDLPGIGRRFDVPADGGELCVVIHHTGSTDLYVRSSPQQVATCRLDDAEARRLGAILGGAYFRPAAVQDLEAAIGGLLIEWVTLREDSPAAGRSIGELEIRQRTRMTVVAILRGDEPLVSPDPTEVMAAGDRLVVAGRPEDLAGFLRHVVG